MSVANRSSEITSGPQTPKVAARKHRSATAAFIKKIWRNSVLRVTRPRASFSNLRSIAETEAAEAKPSSLRHAFSCSDLEHDEECEVAPHPSECKDAESNGSLSDISRATRGDEEGNVPEAIIQELESLIDEAKSKAQAILPPVAVLSHSARQSEASLEGVHDAEEVTEVDVPTQSNDDDEVIIVIEEDALAYDDEVEWEDADWEDAEARSGLTWRRKSMRSIYTDAGSVSGMWVDECDEATHCDAEVLPHRPPKSKRRRSQRATRRFSTFRVMRRRSTASSKFITSTVIPRADANDFNKRKSKRYSRISIDKSLYRRSVYGDTRRQSQLSVLYSEADEEGWRRKRHDSIGHSSNFTKQSRSSAVELQPDGRSRQSIGHRSRLSFASRRRSSAGTGVSVEPTKLPAFLSVYDHLIAQHTAKEKGQSPREVQPVTNNRRASRMSRRISRISHRRFDSIKKLDELLDDIAAYSFNNIAIYEDLDDAYAWEADGYPEGDVSSILEDGNEAVSPAQSEMVPTLIADTCSSSTACERDTSEIVDKQTIPHICSLPSPPTSTDSASVTGKPIIIVDLPPSPPRSDDSDFVFTITQDTHSGSSDQADVSSSSSPRISNDSRSTKASRAISVVEPDALSQNTPVQESLPEEDSTQINCRASISDNHLHPESFQTRPKKKGMRRVYSRVRRVVIRKREQPAMEVKPTLETTDTQPIIGRFSYSSTPSILKVEPISPPSPLTVRKHTPEKKPSLKRFVNKVRTIVF
ncbi:uncharacterized protein SPPG_05598 [Spizellomyces punctatus DAOM BR117]|uniref:Uncharacterized protein n=1 Tax=Spizellomyces punctatus (strain DAOM BR117) TaxID=645134 RepID=A0A0L0HEA0_SPIPD|nr:uncharacterized protein SPPG_05598 [Spizellomyces punctatus DAOM BR117]KNC99351.1 hypothetical protein SPPG_05598 [Spizellomyces punctatus DAOM BR117]|eukprot:XP_016607391.1 hypothetical protein SPPG_05598 [Spizellomyces punctatus DAOM BR117]